MPTKFQIVAYQLVIFPKDLYIEDTEALYRRLLGLGFFEEELSSFFSQKGIPRQVITISLKTSNNRSQCLFSPDRIEMTWEKPESVSDEDAVKRLLSESTAILEEVYRNKNPEIKRIGCITVTAGKVNGEEEQAEFFKTSIARETFRNENVTAYEMKITYEHPPFSSVACNRVMSIMTGKREGTSDDVIAVQQDINTQHSEDARFNIKQARDFAVDAYSESTMEKIEAFVWPQ